MFETIAQAAEQAATSVSRRKFLNHLGRGAVFAASFLGGLLAWPGDAEAFSGKCCFCFYPGGDVAFCYRRPKGQPCESGCRPGNCRSYCS
jgi:hypothetical protein